MREMSGKQKTGICGGFEILKNLRFYQVADLRILKNLRFCQVGDSRIRKNVRFCQVARAGGRRRRLSSVLKTCGDL